MQALRPSSISGNVKGSHLSYMSQASYPSRPLSSATEFSDTDFEDDYPDEQFTARSASSQTTVSTVESLKTPDTAGLGGFEFHFDDKRGDRSPSVENGEAVDLYFGLSPSGNVPIELPIPTSFQPSDLLRKPLSSRSDAADKLDESNVRNWTPEDVADWMCNAGHDDAVVDKFLDHDINGQILLDLQYEDLKELEIACHTKRNAVLDSIKHLRKSSSISLAPMLPEQMLSNQDTKPKDNYGLNWKDNCETESSLRRGRLHHATSEDFISPGESVSIVAVEQVLPKPHVCSKGENCKKWRKQQLKLQQLREELQAMPNTPMTISTTMSRPSVTASSDILGPDLAPPTSITRENLSELRPVDPQESVRQFLGFQHMSPTSPSSGALAEKLRNMPKLTIPIAGSNSAAYFSPAGRQSATPRTVVTPTLRRSKTPISAIKSPAVPHSAVATSRHDRSSRDVHTPSDVYRLASPFSEVDIPVTLQPHEPLDRDTSQSVPPNMQFGIQLARPAVDPVSRPNSAQQQPTSARHNQRRRPSFATPSVALLPEETIATPVTAISSSMKSHFPQSPARPRRCSISNASPQTAFGPPQPSLLQPVGATIPRPSTTAPSSGHMAPPPRSSTVTPSAQLSRNFAPPPRSSSVNPVPPPAASATRTSFTPPRSSTNLSLPPRSMTPSAYRSSTNFSPPPPRAATPSAPYTHTSTPYPNSHPSSSSTNPSTTGRTTNPTSLSSSQLPQLPQISGSMRRRLRTRLLRHEWIDGHFALTGTSLAMYKSEESYLRHSKALEYIDIDDYAIACSTAVSNKKLGSGFFRSALGRSGSVGKGASGNDGSKSAHPGDYRSANETFGFELVPITDQPGGLRKGSTSSSSSSGDKSSVSNGKHHSNNNSKEPHYFAVGTRDERIDWMRELMLAKALKKGREITGGVEGARFECDGENVI